MQTTPLQLGDAIYNAATQSFEARVTVHDHTGTRSYACAIAAPITMEFEDAARGLSIQAMRRHRRGQPDATRLALPTPRLTTRASMLRGLAQTHFGTRTPRAA